MTFLKLINFICVFGAWWGAVAEVRVDIGALLRRSPPESLETQSLSKPGAKLISKPQRSLLLFPPQHCGYKHMQLCPTSNISTGI